MVVVVPQAGGTFHQLFHYLHNRSVHTEVSNACGPFFDSEVNIENKEQIKLAKSF